MLWGFAMPTRKEEPKSSIIFWIVILLLLIFVGYYFVSHNNNKAKQVIVDKEFVVNAIRIINTNMPITYKYIGYVTPIHEVSVTPYINGYLDKVLVEGGMEVKADDVLVVIQQGEYLANLEAAKANKQQAEADYNNSLLYYKRVKAAKNAMSKTEFDNAKAKFLSAEAALSKAKADYDLAKINYEYTLIKAPISGVVGDVGLTRGNYVSPSGGELFSIVQYNPIRVVFSIADKEYLKILQETPRDLFKDAKIQIRLSDGKIHDKLGEYKYIDNSLNKSTNSVAVYVDFENPNKELLPNAYVTVEINQEIKDAIIVKQNMVLMRDDGNFLNIIRDNKIIEVPVEILGIEDNNYYIANKFQKGDLLVLDKIGSLNKNAKIKVNIVGEDKK